jgi:hypothetical protein
MVFLLWVWPKRARVWKQDQGSPQCQKNEHHQNKMVTHLQRACHIVALPFTFFKKNLKAKEKLWKLKYFTMKKYNLKKKPIKKKPKYFKILELKYN